MKRSGRELLNGLMNITGGPDKSREYIGCSIMLVHNEDIAAIFDEIAYLLEIEKANPNLGTSIIRKVKRKTENSLDLPVCRRWLIN
ncbi:MAG: helix-hairpin-helix domain-containing protein [Smithella sp.]